MHPLARNVFRCRAGQKLEYGGVTYTIAGKLGDGAVGVVRRAVTDSGAEVAIKFLAPDPKYIDPTTFDDVAARFVYEGKRGAKLDHARLVDVYGYAANAGGGNFVSKGPSNPFLIMERVKGKTLEGEIRATRDELAGGLEFTKGRLSTAIQIADALHYIHGKKLVHRDVKPANIFISGYTKAQLPLVKLGDFGIVKWGDFHQHLASGTLTMTHQQGLGTLKYMSPEQAIKPKDVTVKSDVFSFGITLYEILTGKLLASPHHVFQVMNARLSRGSTHAKFLTLGHNLMGPEDRLCERLLDCFLRGTANRPKIGDLRGCLTALYSQLYDREWTEDLR